MRTKWILLSACLFGFSSVALGAFAAHGLKNQLSPYLIGVFNTGVEYQMWHSLALLAIGVWLKVAPSTLVAKAGLFFIIGILCFSGSLYALALTGIKWFGPITPFGGFCFLIGWATLMVAAWRSE